MAHEEKIAFRAFLLSALLSCACFLNVGRPGFLAFSSLGIKEWILKVVPI